MCVCVCGCGCVVCGVKTHAKKIGHIGNEQARIQRGKRPTARTRSKEMRSVQPRDGEFNREESSKPANTGVNQQVSSRETLSKSSTG
jgi:hypothetical protein